MSELTDPTGWGSACAVFRLVLRICGFVSGRGQTPCRMATVLFDARIWRRSGGGRAGYMTAGLPTVVCGVLRYFMRRLAALQTTRRSLSDTLGRSLSVPRFSSPLSFPQMYCAVRLWSRVLAGLVRRGVCSCRPLVVPHEDHRGSNDCRAGEGRCAQGPSWRSSHRPVSHSRVGSERSRACISSVYRGEFEESWIRLR